MPFKSIQLQTFRRWCTGRYSRRWPGAQAGRKAPVSEDRRHLQDWHRNWRLGDWWQNFRQHRGDQMSDAARWSRAFGGSLSNMMHEILYPLFDCTNVIEYGFKFLEFGLNCGSDLTSCNKEYVLGNMLSLLIYYSFIRRVRNIAKSDC